MNPALALGLALPTLLVACFLLAAHRSINDWLLPLLTRLAHPQGNFLTRGLLWPVAKAAQGAATVVNYVDHHLSVAASHTMAPLARFMGGFAAWITNLAYNAAGFTRDTADGFERVVAHTIPHEIGLATHPLWRWVRRHNKAILGLLLPEIVLGRWLWKAMHHRVLPQLKHLYHQTTVALPRAIAREGLRIKDLERALTHPSRAWLRRTARWMWALVFAGLLLRTLARRFPWLFCRKINNPRTGVGKYLCAMDQGLLNSLLWDTLALTSAISVVAMAKELQSLEGVIIGIMKQGIEEL